MITTSRFKSALLHAGSRILTLLQYGTYGARTAVECMPWGEDSQPLPGATALLAETGADGDAFVLGYKNKQQLASAGEKRLYSLKSDGTLSFYAWLKNDGTMVLGGDDYHLVRYEPLNTGLTNQDTAINTELAKIATAIGSLGGVYTPGTISTDITASKIDEIKCI